MSRRLKITLVLSVLYLGLIRFSPIWERYPGGLWNVLFYSMMLVLFFVILIMGIIEVVRIIKSRNNFSFKMILPLLILSLVIFDGWTNLLKINLESIYGESVFEAYYEGTQNQAIFKLRDNGKFDIHWTGVFFSDEYFTGVYIKKGDTILMNFETEIPNQLGEILIVKEECIYKLINDTIVPTYFYLGGYKGLN